MRNSTLATKAKPGTACRTMDSKCICGLAGGRRRAVQTQRVQEPTLSGFAQLLPQDPSASYNVTLPTIPLEPNNCLHICVGASLTTLPSPLNKVTRAANKSQLFSMVNWPVNTKNLEKFTSHNQANNGAPPG